MTMTKPQSHNRKSFNTLQHYAICDGAIRALAEAYENVFAVCKVDVMEKRDPALRRSELKKFKRILSNIADRIFDHMELLSHELGIDDDNDDPEQHKRDTLIDDGCADDDPTISDDDLLRDSCDYCPDFDDELTCDDSCSCGCNTKSTEDDPFSEIIDSMGVSRDEIDDLPPESREALAEIAKNFSELMKLTEAIKDQSPDADTPKPVKRKLKLKRRALRKNKQRVETVKPAEDENPDSEH